MDIRLQANIRARAKAPMPKTSFERIFKTPYNEEVYLGYKEVSSDKEVYAIRNKVEVPVTDKLFSIKLIDASKLLDFSYNITIGDRTIYTPCLINSIDSYISSNTNNEIFLEGKILGDIVDSITIEYSLIYIKWGEYIC